jgi:serine protease AprX
MGRVFFLFLFITMLASFNGWCQSYYWVGFSDKNNNPLSLSNPGAFLSERALERRLRQNIAVDSLDLPVNPGYISQVLGEGVTFIHSSKWLNGITVRTDLDSFSDEVIQLPFVKEVQLTKRSFSNKSTRSKFIDQELKNGEVAFDSMQYGESVHQVHQLNLQYLHNNGFMGQGMHIAVLDAGFYRADTLAAFNALWEQGRVLGTYDFVDGDEFIFDGHFHGMSVLSAMAGNVPGKLLGTAPEASYWLFRSEDEYSEFLIEEYNWLAAAEFADSAGVDIINSSLGYFTFDDPEMNHTYASMDGNTTPVTRGANIAVTRGMLVVSSAGNEGRATDSWKYIIAPSDGDNVIGVGAVNKEGIPAPFTSYGPASDGDVKPNVAAVGWNTIIQRSDGSIGTGNGTSFSSPVIAGAVACLWQANRNIAALQIKKAIEMSAHLFLTPDSLIGYGIPDFKLADRLIKETAIEPSRKQGTWGVYPNPASNYIVLQKRVNAVFGKVMLTFYSLDGKLIHMEERNDAAKIVLQNLQMLPPGLLLLQITSGDVSEVVKIYKSH